MLSSKFRRGLAGVFRATRLEAMQSGRPVWEYLVGRLVEEAHRPPVDEVLARSAARFGGSISFDPAVHILREERDSR